MKPVFEFLSNELIKKKIRLSRHRMKVLEYLMNQHNHPSADQIYSAIKKEVSTLSKTTIYNTLNTLTEAGLVKVLTINENETRYEIETENHGHFICKSCGTIYDFKIHIDNVFTEGLSHFQINSKEVCFKGVCQKCLKNKLEFKEYAE